MLSFAVTVLLATLSWPACAGETKSGFFTSKRVGSPAAIKWVEKMRQRKPKFDALDAKLKALPPDDQHARTPLELACPLMLESAYVAAVSDQAHDVEPDGTETFHMFLSGADTMFDLVYVYTPKGEVWGARVDRLPSDWRLTFMSESKGATQVMSKDGCLWTFDLGNPFGAAFVAVVPTD